MSAKAEMNMVMNKTQMKNIIIVNMTSPKFHSIVTLPLGPATTRRAATLSPCHK
jgi:hypothetical protein